ncbi:MAG: hypothetical protein OEZ43_17635 [Gammaproteobacteria bacterium]|nr:hypothetical protein [Gammaproteobacteria bacterium]
MKLPQTVDAELHQLVETIQHNCDIADAQNAQENPMCIYLLKMRDYFRWMHQLPLNASIPREKLGKWINERERHWDVVAEEEMSPLCIEGEEFDAFDTAGVNKTLATRGLIYSAGIGRGGQIHFHLGNEIPFLTDREQGIFVTSQEYARDLTANPAHSIDSRIFLRKEALQHYIWGKYEEWRLKRADNAMSRAIKAYPFEHDPIRAINQMSGIEIYSAWLHEQGEIAACKLLGGDWEKLLVAVQGSRSEIICRAVRDHLADTLVTLPALLEDENFASIHFYMANLEGFRKVIWPELVQVYRNHPHAPFSSSFTDTAVNHQPWLAHANEILAIYRAEGSDCGPALKAHLKVFEL